MPPVVGRRRYKVLDIKYGGRNYFYKRASKPKSG